MEHNPYIYTSDNYVVIDFETTNNDKGSALSANDLLLVVYKKGNHRHRKYFKKWGDVFHQQELIRCIELADFVVAHNAKFELQWLKQMGLDLSNVLVFDTQVAEYTLHGNLPVLLSLDETAKRRGFKGKEPFIDICMKGGICPSNMPRSLLANRCVEDVIVTEQIFLQQRTELLYSGRLPLLYSKCLLTVALADIEFNGMKLDKDRVLAEYKEHVLKRNSLSDELDQISNGINPRSRKQVAELLYDVLKFDEPVDYKGNPYRTPAGARQVDETVLSKLVAKTPEQEKFLALKREFASVDADLTKNLDFFFGVVTEGNGIFNAQFNQTVTRTHRLSSSGRPVKFEAFDKPKSVQFQNLPRKYKKLFRSRYEGWNIVEVDLAQLEFRVAGFLCKDEQVLKDVVNHEDIHSYTAAVLTDEGQETTRQEAKKHTFKPLYGGQSGTKAEKAYYEAFKRKYRGVATAQQSWINRVLLAKELVLPNGMVFYWPDVKMENGWVNYTSNICNYPVQHFATAEIVPIFLYEIWSRCKHSHLESFIVNTIHDSVIAEVPQYELMQYQTIVNDAMYAVYKHLKDLYDIEFFMPLGYEVKVGINLGEGQEAKVETESPYTYTPESYNEDY